MKLYRIQWYPQDESALDRDWASTKRDANRIARESGDEAEVVAIDVPTDKKGLLEFLRSYAS